MSNPKTEIIAKIGNELSTLYKDSQSYVNYKFSYWFERKNVDSIKYSLNRDKYNPSALSEHLDTIVKKFDTFFKENEKLEKIAHGIYQLQRSWTGQDVNVIKTMKDALPHSKLRTLDLGSLKMIDKILLKIHISMRKFQKVEREFEEEYKNWIFNRKFDSVRNVLGELAIFALNNPATRSIETKRMKSKAFFLF